MIRTVSALRSLSILATDGDIGSVKDIYFDDQNWVIRYLVVDTGGWLLGRKVLVSPYAVRSIDWDRNTLEVSITREQVKGSPNVDTEKPVSRQHEVEYLGYYGYPPYWGGTMAWGAMPFPGVDATLQDAAARALRERDQSDADPHLRSFAEVSKYAIDADDGKFGHVDDFLFDEESWALRYLVVDTRTWLPGRRVLVSSEWIDTVDWSARRVEVGLSREAIRESPEWDADRLFTPEDEAVLYRHYSKTPHAARGAQIR